MARRISQVANTRVLGHQTREHSKLASPTKHALRRTVIHAAPERPPSEPPQPSTRSILEQYRPDEPINICHEQVITGDPAESLWQAYCANFEPLQAVAILQHFDSYDVFLGQLADPRIVKIVGWRGDEPVGLAMVTNCLEAVAEISPAFLRSRYPDFAAKDQIYVGMLVMVSQSLRGLTLFSRLYLELWQVPALVGGILIFDICDFNRNMFDTDALSERIASNFARSSVQVLDRQTWYVAELPEPIGGNRLR
jgi:hypothetical protein